MVLVDCQSLRKVSYVIPVLGGGRFSNLPLIQAVGSEDPTAHKENLSACFIGHRKPVNSLYTLELSMGHKFTLDQELACDFRRNICLTAGAGAGKTAVLTERLLRILEKTHLGISRILVVTFTEKATAELKDRILEKIEQQLEKQPSSAHWQKLVDTFGENHISTFHAFCARILREFAYEAGQDPEFGILDNPEQNGLVQEVVADEIDRLAAQSTCWELERLSRLWSRGQIISHITMLIEERTKLGHNSPKAWHECLDRLSFEQYTARLERYQSFYFQELNLSEKEQKEYSIDLELEQVGFELKQALASLVRTCLTLFQERKRQLRVLDFTDLGLITAGLLQSQSHILEELRRRFRYIMVDEFQDTDPLQWEILRLLAQAPDRRDGAGLAGDKLFIVGDEKQSIYGFRGADVSVFSSAKRELIQANLKANTHREPFSLPQEMQPVFTQLPLEHKERRLQGEMELSHNFRCSQELLKVYNPFFERLFYRENYRSYDARAQAQTGERQVPQSKVELLLVEKSGNRGNKLADYLREALLIAQKIKQIQTAGKERYPLVWEKLCPPNPRSANPNPVAYEPVTPAIAILLFQRNMLKVYEYALRREGIKFLVGRGRGFFQRREVQDLIQVLQFLLSPNRDIPLAGALRSPLVGISDDALLTLSCRPGSGLWQKLSHLCENRPSGEDFSPQDWENLALGFRHLQSWLALKDRLGPAELTRKIMEDACFGAALSFGRRRRQNLSNLEKLMEMARRYEAKGQGLPEWVAYLLQQETYENEGEAEPSLGGAPSTVQIMTVHQAKGLEFPLVFVPDLASLISQSNTKSVLAGNLSDAAGEYVELGIKAYHPTDPTPQDTLARKLMAAKEKETGLAEKRRLFYVAATRAQDHLCLVGQVDPNAPARKQPRYWIDWILDILEIEAPEKAGDASLKTAAGKAIALPVTWFPKNHGSGDHDPEVEQILSCEPPSLSTPTTGRCHLEKGGTLISASYREEDFGEADLAEAKSIVAAALEPPLIPERLTLSHTSLSNYLDCPFKFYLSERLRIPEERAGPGEIDPKVPIQGGKETPKRMEALLRGRIIHQLLEEGYPTAAIDQRLVQLLADIPPCARRSKLKAEILEHLKRLEADPEFRKLPRTGRNVYRERPFRVNLEGVCLEGYIDLLYYDQDAKAWIVIDYKTGEAPDEDEGKLQLKIEQERYDFQLACYCLAASRILGEPVVSAGIMFTQLPKLMKITFSQVELEKIEHRSSL